MGSSSSLAQREHLKNPALTEDRTQERQRLPIPLLQVHLLVHAMTMLGSCPGVSFRCRLRGHHFLTLMTAFLRNGTTDAGCGLPGKTVLPSDRLVTDCGAGCSS